MQSALHSGVGMQARGRRVYAGYGTLFGQAPWKFQLDLSNKSVIESNSRNIKFISRKKEAIEYHTAMRTSGKPCIDQYDH